MLCGEGISNSLNADIACSLQELALFIFNQEGDFTFYQ